MFNDNFKNRYRKIPLAISECLPGQATEVLLHWHKEVELITVTSGQAEFYVNGEGYEISAGDTLVIPPCALHRATVAAEWDTRYICVCFDAKLLCDGELSEGLESGSLTVTPHIKSCDTAATRSAALVRDAFCSCREGREGWELAAVGSVSLLFAALKSEGRIVPCIKQGHDRAFCMKTVAYIKENYRENISSRSASEGLYLNNSYFCRQFQRNFGISFSEYLLNWRVEKAKELIRHSQKPISTVAEEVGFNDFSYFSKVFKKVCGVTPSAYRKNCAVEWQG